MSSNLFTISCIFKQNNPKEFISFKKECFLFKYKDNLIKKLVEINSS